MASNDYGKKTMMHKFAVEMQMNLIAKDIRQRGMRHDNSKHSGTESTLGKMYGDEFPVSWFDTEVSDNVKPAIAVHHKENDHHPEHFEGGMKDMTIPQVTEMICDIVETARQNYIPLDDIIEFIKTTLSERYDIGEPMRSIMVNTAQWLYSPKDNTDGTK